MYASPLLPDKARQGRDTHFRAFLVQTQAEAFACIPPHSCQTQQGEAQRHSFGHSRVLTVSSSDKRVFSQRSDSARRSAHTFFGARYVPIQPPTLENLGSRREDRISDRHRDAAQVLGEGGLTPSPVCGLPAPVGGRARNLDSGSGAGSPLALVGGAARAHQHVPTPLAGSPLLQEEDDDAPEMLAGTDSSREPSVCQSEAESEGQASEAGESSEVSLMSWVVTASIFLDLQSVTVRYEILIDKVSGVKALFFSWALRL